MTQKAQSFHLYLFFCVFVPFFFPLNFDMLVSVFARFDTLEAPRPCLAEPVFASICSKPFVYACGGCSKSWFCASLGSSVFEARRFDQFSKTRVFTGSPPSNVVGGLPQETAGGKPSESKKKKEKIRVARAPFAYWLQPLQWQKKNAALAVLASADRLLTILGKRTVCLARFSAFG